MSLQGLCEGKPVKANVSASSVNGSSVFPTCPEVKKIFDDMLPTGKNTTQIQGGPTLTATCGAGIFFLVNAGTRIEFEVPMPVCLELSDRINKLNL